MNGSDRLRRLTGAALISSGLVMGATSLAQPVTAIQAATQTVPLHNDIADPDSDCPSEPGAYWHFIIAPNNNTFEFVEITLNVGGTILTVSGSAIIPNGSQLDNVFVRVPAGADHGDLTTAGSFALIAPDTRSVRFVLSHLCTVGSTVTTTAPSTTTSTTSTSTTSTTSPSTSTTAPANTSTTSTTTTPASTSTTSTSPSTSTTTSTTSAPVSTTSTTVAAVTTTTTGSSGGAVTTTTQLSDGSGGTTTSTVASGAGATTSTVAAAAGTTTSVASGAVTTAAPASVPLPSTGSDLPRTLGVLSLLTLSIGGVLLLLARRSDGGLGHTS